MSPSGKSKIRTLLLEGLDGVSVNGQPLESRMITFHELCLTGIPDEADGVLDRQPRGDERLLSKLRTHVTPGIK